MQSSRRLFLRFELVAKHHVSLHGALLPDWSEISPLYFCRIQVYVRGRRTTMREEHQGCTADSHIAKAKCAGNFVKNWAQRRQRERHSSHALCLNEVS